MKVKAIQSIPIIDVSTPCEPPEWALLERLLIKIINKAALEFVDRYTNSDKTLIWREQWSGMDGSDDPYEGFMNYPLFYALGGSEEVYRASREMWEAITWQWTQYGQIHDEFDAYYDWMHHGEGYLFFYFFGLANPLELKDRQRAIKFASLYTGDAPDAPNYDKEKKLIRSPITGSKGPRHHQTAEDWETHREIFDNYLPPFEDLPGIDPHAKVCPWSNDEIYAEILKRINERQARGDVPINLGSTSLVTHAFLYTADEKYRLWVIEYLDAWKERTERNGGITPDNIGLSGEIGEYNEGKWWGGYYGWRWPHGAMSILEPLLVAGSNATMLTGELKHLELARSQIDMLISLGKKSEDGYWVVPSRHYDEGWIDYRPLHPMFPIYLWNISMLEEDAIRAEQCLHDSFFDKVDDRLKAGVSMDGVRMLGSHIGFSGNTAQWFRYIRGKDSDYPVNILKSNYQVIRSQLEKIRSDEFDPHTMDHYKEAMSIHMWQELMPVVVEGLAQLTLGAPMHIYHGGLQHAPLRYYDAVLQRPGLPEDVAALVEHVDSTSVTIELVNTSLFHEREVILQAGTFGEHLFIGANKLDGDGQRVEIPLSNSNKWLKVLLNIGSCSKLQLKMERYVNKPSYATPWANPNETDTAIKGRDV